MGEAGAVPIIEEGLISLARSIDEFEGYVNPHASRIAGLADAIASGFGLSAHDRQSLKMAAMVHDLGELVMNRDYIRVERELAKNERLDMQRHPVIGEQESSRRGLPRSVQLLVRWHHEWWCGAGYPDSLSRESIPLGARILRVCDTYAALTDARPYSVPVSSVDAKKFLSDWAGIEFDPKVVVAFLSLRDLVELESLGDHQAKSLV